MSKSLITPDTQLVSFDLWLTLIKSNGKHFKNARNAYMGSLLAPQLSEEAFDTIVRAQDKLADTIAETREHDVLFGERVAMVAQAVDAPKPSEDLLAHLYETQGKLFQKNLPLLLDENTPDLLGKLHKRYALGIVSNTGYMHGDQMRPALDAIGIGQHFDYAVFSNEVGYAKPHHRIFETLLEQAGVEPAAVTHVGDNERADVNGARALGMRAIHFAGDMTLRKLVESAGL